ncbi:peroxiredoxin-like family protein [Anthocerotibacter panamensis]|uniref:peroxiredoxin-like family protein n=1 Tax=Anthocerotibacter panamensis TaxID=2857077 RepID=UPI001C402FCF|nr:peroxiredoxin-like family protein [Anthocerotibacter panamensis]
MNSGLFNQRFARNFLYIPPLPALKLGEYPPDFELPQVGGGTVRLSDFRGRQPVIVAFTRIFTEKLFCPFCYPHIQELKTTYRTIQEHGAELLMVSSTTPEQSEHIVRDLALPYPFLSDPACATFRAYRLGQALGAPLPGQFLVDDTGRLRFKHRYSFVEANAPEQELLAAVHTLAKKNIGAAEKNSS